MRAGCLIEAAQHYRLSPKVSKELSARQQGLSEEIKACSWKAQTRLHQRMMQLLARGKERNKVTVAVARELCGFVWHIFRLMEPRMTQSRRRRREALKKKRHGNWGGIPAEPPAPVRTRQTTSTNNSAPRRKPPID